MRGLKLALRQLFHKPGTAGLAIIVVAVGIGLPLYVIGLTYNMIYKPLPLEDGERIVTIKALVGGGDEAIDLHDYEAIKHEALLLEEMGAWRGTGAVVSFRDGSRQLGTILANHNMFEFSGVEPALGTTFSASDEARGSAPVVVLGHEVWRQMGANEQIVGTTLRIDGKPTRVVGVMPEGYEFPMRGEIWMPLQLNPDVIPRGDGGTVRGFAKFKRGVTIDQVNAEIAAIMEGVEARFPETNTGVSAYAVSIPRSFYLGADMFFFGQIALGVILLMLALVNVCALLLAKALERGKETALRMALGATRARAMQQFMWESVVICSIGGIIGLLAAGWCLELSQLYMASIDGRNPFWWIDLGIDGFMVFVFLVIVAFAILASGLIPGWRATDQDPSEALRDGTAQASAGKRTGALTFVLVTIEIFLSVTLLVAATTTTLGMVETTQRDYGTRADDMLVAGVRLSNQKYEEDAARARFASDLERELKSSGLQGAIAISTVVPGDEGPREDYQVRSNDHDQASGALPRATLVSLTPGSLGALNISILEGRDFDTTDRSDGRPVAIVSEEFSRREWSGASAIGQQVRVPHGRYKTDWMTVVGVVSHVAYDESSRGREAQLPAIYRPMQQAPTRAMAVFVEARGTVAEMTSQLRNVVAYLDADVAVADAVNLREVQLRTSAGLRFISYVFMALAIVGLLLASSGVFGMMSQVVTQRTREMGIKRALGATDNRIFRELARYTALQLLFGGVTGALVGGAIGWTLARVIGIDAVGLVVASTLVLLILSGVLLVATWLPSRQLISHEPSAALRYE